MEGRERIKVKEEEEGEVRESEKEEIKITRRRMEVKKGVVINVGVI